MDYAHAALPRLRIDGKRIAATSGVIALHLGLLMLLMMPPPMSAPPAEEEVVVIPDWQPRRLPPPPPPPPKDIDKPRPQPRDAQPLQLPVVEPIVEAVDQTPGPMDIAAPEVIEAPTTFDTGPAAAVFVQLVPDVAPAPPYPKAAAARRIEGTVVLRIHVDASGRPIEVSVESSSGSGLLDEAARKFVQARWHFVPAQQDGRATEAWALLPIEFVLR